MSTQTAAKSALSEVVASNIRAEAARRGWTQVEMSRRVGMSKVAMSDRYRGRTPWALDELELVAGALGVEVGDLLARPKGFEPLTFWLGADHTLTVAWFWDSGDLWFCDECGERKALCYSPGHAEAGAWAHSLGEHRGVHVERAA